MNMLTITLSSVNISGKSGAKRNNVGMEIILFYISSSFETF